jgi:hypothetical protein
LAGERQAPAFSALALLALEALDSAEPRVGATESSECGRLSVVGA